MTKHDEKIVRFLVDTGFAKTREDAMAGRGRVVLYEDATMTDVAKAYVAEYADLNGYGQIIALYIDYEGLGDALETQGRYVKKDGDIFQLL